MSGDWIKMRTNLDTDPRVVGIAERLGVTEFEVVGCLWKVWAWADEHSLDGNAISVTSVTLERITRVAPGFMSALIDVGWLLESDGKITFPRFDEHNGNTAKSRALTQKRVKRHRNVESVTPALPEKRREDIKKNKQKKLPPKDWKPSPATAEWFAEQGFGFTLDDMVERFIDTCHSNGRKYLDFDATLRNWSKKRQAWMNEKKPNEPHYPDLQA